MPRNSKKTRAGGARVRPRWTKEEVSTLKRLYRTTSNAEIAKVLGRKVSSVVFKGHRLGLSKGAQRLREMGQENIRKRWGTPKRRAAARRTAAAAKPGPARRTRAAGRRRAA